MKISEWFDFNDEIREIIEEAPSVIVPRDRAHILDLATGNGLKEFMVKYDVEALVLSKKRQ